MLLAIMAVGGLVAFFFYHRVVVTKLEQSLANFEAELDYIEDVLQLMRLQYNELDKMLTRRSKVTRPAKSFKKRGRPVDPNSARQKKLKGGK